MIWALLKVGVLYGYVGYSLVESMLLQEWTVEYADFSIEIIYSNVIKKMKL